jgi:hypothetical protein
MLFVTVEIFQGDLGRYSPDSEISYGQIGAVFSSPITERGWVRGASDAVALHRTAYQYLSGGTANAIYQFDTDHIPTSTGRLTLPFSFVSDTGARLPVSVIVRR